jgi:hypothetical protein
LKNTPINGIILLMESRQYEKFSSSPAIIEDLLNPEPILAVDLYMHERELLEKPVLGKGSHGEALFNHFSKLIRLAPQPRGINRIQFRIMHTTTTPAEIRTIRSERGNFFLVFNDTLSGHNLALEHTQNDGVFFAMIEDRLEPHKESVEAMQDIMEVPSFATITLVEDGRLYMQGVVKGELVKSRIKDKAELGFSSILHSLLWSPAHTP